MHFKMNLSISCIAALALASMYGVNGHGTLLEPPQRSSIWRDPRFKHLNLPPNYDDAALWCNGVKQDYVPKQCGICGDGLALPRPRPNENGGTYGKGTIAGIYTKGQEIPILFALKARHNGYFQIQICDNVATETEECFLKRGFLPLAGGTTDRIDVTGLLKNVTTTVKLPADLTCDHCVLRLHYRAAKDWGECDGVCKCKPPGAIGCGVQELVRNCADIRIRGFNSENEFSLY